MAKIFDFSIFKLNNDIELTNKQRSDIDKNIAITNIKRLRIGLSITAIMEIVLVLAYDLPRIKDSIFSIKEIYIYYLLLHSLIIIVCLLGFALLNKWLNNNEIFSIKLIERVIYFTLGAILVLLTLISGLDQITTGQILVFGINIIFSGLVILIKPPYENIMYTCTFMTFIIVMIIFQHNFNILISNLVNGSFFFVSALFLSKFMHNNQVAHLAKNIKLQEVNRKLQYLSDYDYLTGIPNRRYFMKQLKDFACNEKETNDIGYVVIVDIDYFKNINDTYGHLIGDYVLKAAADILKNNLKKHDLLARFGGEEFLILISSSNLEETKVICENLRSLIEQCTFNFEKNEIKITGSFGISPIYNISEVDFDKAYSHADKALYEAKRTGRNKVCIF
ncbi:GGDEF domain-containing protein [Clostridium sp. YIM B02505]|uniref:GGDEF domain-containing protein n=1 Tax=Clostridium yunnanense TaxID=2800325 RepID=A0ABS1EP42_9CLOT|nr:GGDEF domain-containing protein [Clostridium yunnanense]